MAFDFQGTGWAFPIRLNTLGQVEFSQGEPDINEAIELIIKTARGERVMRSDFGCGIHDLVFEPINAGTLALVEANILEALTQFEPRIEVLNVEVGPDEANRFEGQLLIEVQYRVRATNNEFNLVFPFFLKEGNG